MGENAPNSFEDDYLERLEKTFRPEFIKNVDNPTRFTDFLQCLEILDCEIVRAQQDQYGAMHAAGVLYARLTRRPNWIGDAIRALRDPSIGLGFLAEQLERSLLTVPARWDICSFKDEKGLACFNGHCSDDESDLSDTSNDKMKVLKYDTLNETPKYVRNDQSIQDHSKYLESDTAVETDDEHGASNTADSSTDFGIPSSVSDGHQISVSKNDTSEPKPEPESISRETLHLRRENLRLKLMEKIYSLVQKPGDVPIAIHYMDKINIQIDKIDRGSVIFSVYIDSLEALQAFEELWRYGGLKKLLDKEMLDDDMVKELKAVAIECKHPVEDIQSDLRVFDTDLERCRSWLIKNYFDIHPFGFAGSLTMLNGETSRTLRSTEIAKYAADRLPEELRALIEDPFISDRIAQFYESEMLRKNFNDYRNSFTERVSVAQCFVEWMNNETSAYLKGLGDTTAASMLCVAVYLVHLIESGGTATIPYHVLSESFDLEPVKRYFSTAKYDRRFWFDMSFPSEITLDSKTVQHACEWLIVETILCNSKGKCNFQSLVLRDIFITKVILCSSFKGSLKNITNSFEYVPTLIGMYRSKILKYISHQAEEEFTKCIFKTAELRDVGIRDLGTGVAGTESVFYNQDLIFSRQGIIDVTDEVFEAGYYVKMNESYTKKHITVDLSTAANLGSLTATLHWLNVKALTIGCFTRSIILNNRKLNDRDMQNIGHYLNATPEVLDLCLRKSQLEADVLANVFKMGWFRNISRLNISDNTVIGDSGNPIGLMYIRALERLDIQNCNLGDGGMKMLAMDLMYTGKLRELNIANNGMSSKGILHLTNALSTNKRLTSLRIQKNFIGKDGSLILASWLEGLLLLEVLNMSECGIGDEGSLAIAGSLVSRSLQKLSMRSNKLSAKGSREFFKKFRRPPHLEHLDFSENSLFPVSYSSIALQADDTTTNEPIVEFLRYPTPMSHLSLWNTGIGIKRLFRGLQNFKCFEKMTYLCLQENSMSDDFARDLSDCIQDPKCTHLQHINLRQNLIGTRGAIALANALSTQMYLNEVLLDRNEIGDEGANQIVDSCASLPSISRIDLSCNRISQRRLDGIVSHLEGTVSRRIKDVIEEVSTEVLEPPQSFDGTSSFEYNPPKVTGDVFGVVRKHDSYDDNSFVINRQGANFVVTM